VSLDDLIQQRTVCLAEGVCPDELHAEIDRREIRALERAQVREAWGHITDCPTGTFFYCADFWCQDRARGNMPNPRGMSSGCVHDSQLRDIFQR